MNQNSTRYEALQPESVSLCRRVRASFSEYLDGAVTGHEMLTIVAHLESCLACEREFAAVRSMQSALAGLRSQKPPADLGLKLRVAISQQKALQASRWTDRLALCWENAVRPMVLQISAGFAGTVILIGTISMLVGMVAAPEAVMAHDVPLGAMTVPHYLYSAGGERPIVTSSETTIVVDAAINARGQVYDYKIVSGPESPEVSNQIAEQLMLSIYTPASVFGAPVRGHVIVTFAGISVRA